MIYKIIEQYTFVCYEFSTDRCCRVILKSFECFQKFFNFFNKNKKPTYENLKVFI